MRFLTDKRVWNTDGTAAAASPTDAGQSQAAAVEPSAPAAGAESAGDEFNIIEAFEQLSSYDSGEEAPPPADGGQQVAGATGESVTPQTQQQVQPQAGTQAVAPTQPQPQAQPGTATAPGQPTGAVAAAQPGQQVQTIAQPQVAQAPAAQAPAVRPEEILSTIHREVEKNFDTFVGQLANTYKLSPQEAEALGFTQEQADAVAMLAGKVHANVTKSMSGMYSQHIPVMVNGILKARDANAAAKSEFYSAWPQLKPTDAAHSQMITQVANTWRQLNPQADRATFISMVGMLACNMLGLPAQRAAQAPQPNGQAGQPQTAQQLVVQTPGPVVRTVPAAYSPPAAGGAPSSALPQGQRNPWDLMAEQIMLSELGETR